MDDRRESELCGGSPPSEPPPDEVSKRRKRSSFSENCVKKLKSLNDGVDNDQENTRGVNGTADVGVEKPLVGGKANEPNSDLVQERKVIKMKGALPNLALPDGWIALNHRSGGIIYLHRPTRVCTWSRPYFIGQGSVRKHDVPLAAVPCLHHKKALEKENKNKNSEISTMNAEFKQGGTLLNLLNAPEAVGAKELENETSSCSSNLSVNGMHVSPQREQLMENEIIDGMDGPLSENTMTCILHGIGKPLDKPSQDNSTDGLVNNMSEGSELTTQEDAPVVSELPQNGFDVIIGLQNVDFGIDSDSKVSNVELAVHSDDANQGRTSWEATSKGIIDEKSPHSETLSAKAKNSSSGAVSWDANSGNGNVLLANGEVSPSSGIELVDAQQLGNYLSNLWEFENLTEEQERNALVVQPDIQEETEIELPTSLECLPYSVKGIEVGKQGKETLFDSHNKTPVAILHEHCQRTLKAKPVYVNLECDDPNTPFMAEVQIEGMKYGSGTGATKKKARQEAAEATLEVLLPGLLKKKREYVVSQEELEFFDKIDITDRQLYNLCTRVNIPVPSLVLQECLKRNHGICPSTINFRLIPGQNQDHIYMITCGKHTATGSCRNKKIGKQLASQAILQKLHPHLKVWGSLLRIYCDRPMAAGKKSKKEMAERLDSDLPHDERLLLKLKEAMLKLSNERESASGSQSSTPPPHSVFTIEV